MKTMTIRKARAAGIISLIIMMAVVLLCSTASAFAADDDSGKKFSFTEGLSNTIAEVPQKEMADTIPDNLGAVDDKLVLTLLRNRIPDLSVKQIAKMDMTEPSGITEDDLKACTTYPGLKGCEKAFVKAEKDHGVNAAFLYGIAVTESSGGAAMFKPNNMFGYGQESFSSKAEGIDYVAKKIAEDYLSEDGAYYNGKTAADVNKIYCTGSTWHGKVERAMHTLYQDMRAHNLEHYADDLNDSDLLNDPDVLNDIDALNYTLSLNSTDDDDSSDSDDSDGDSSSDSSDSDSSGDNDSDN